MDERAQHDDITDLWRKSSYSADQGACIEINQKSPWMIAVRDSMDISGPRLFFSLADWKTFTCQVKYVKSDVPQLFVD